MLMMDGASTRPMETQQIRVLLMINPQPTDTTKLNRSIQATALVTTHSFQFVAQMESPSQMLVDLNVVESNPSNSGPAITSAGNNPPRRPPAYAMTTSNLSAEPMESLTRTPAFPDALTFMLRLMECVINLAAVLSILDLFVGLME